MRGVCGTGQNPQRTKINKKFSGVQKLSSVSTYLPMMLRDADSVITEIKMSNKIQFFQIDAYVHCVSHFLNVGKRTPHLWLTGQESYFGSWFWQSWSIIGWLQTGKGMGQSLMEEAVRLTVLRKQRQKGGAGQG